MLSIAGLLTGMYALFGGSGLLFLSVAAGILLSGGLALYAFGPRGFNIKRTVTPVSTIAGNTVTVKLHVRFRSWIPLPWMIIKESWSGGSHRELLFPGFRRTFIFTYTLSQLSRGEHRLENCCISWGDVPGWFTGRKLLEGASSSFKVLPAPLYFGRENYQDVNLTWATVSSAMGRGKEEGADIREYIPGDPLSRIHWKSTARHGSLHSRIPERESGMICIVLDHAPKSYEVPTGKLVPRSARGSIMPMFEKAVSTAVGLMLTAERSGTYVQLFSGGWPEGMARHEGLGKIPGRVLQILTDIKPDSTRSLPELLEDASRAMIPGMSLSIVTGLLEPEAAKAVARLLMQGVKVTVYYGWDQRTPFTERSPLEPGPPVKATIGESLKRLGAELYCLEQALPAGGRKEGIASESVVAPEVR